MYVTETLVFYIKVFIKIRTVIVLLLLLYYYSIIIYY